MKCYLCKKEIQKAIRHFLLARNHREKSKFRNLCDSCFETQMAADGYIKTEDENCSLPCYIKKGE